MGLFSRRRSSSGRAARADRTEAIERFWSWWRSSGAAQTAQAIAARNPERVAETLNKRVEAIHPDLAWELGAGQQGAEHVLVVTAGGNDELRAVARRWRLAAPEPDAVWEYADARRAVPELTFRLTLDGVAIEAEQAQVTARVQGPYVHVVVHHPAFAELPEQGREAAAFLLLDATLGEVDVETWVGSVSTSPVAPLDPVPLAGLRAVTEHLREQHTDEHGDPVWVLLEGTTADGSAVIAGAQVPLVAATAPQFDTYVAVAVPYSDRDERGFPGPATFPRLRAMEDHLSARLGRSGRLVAHQMSGGIRVLHFYVDGATPAAEQLEASVGGWEQGRVQVEERYDPGWKAVAHLRP